MPCLHMQDNKVDDSFKRLFHFVDFLKAKVAQTEETINKIERDWKM